MEPVTDLVGSVKGHGRQLVLVLALVVLGVGAGVVAFALQPPVSGTVGPGSITIDPSLRAGDTVVDLPPLGQIRADTHRGPFGFDARVDRIDFDRAGVVVHDKDPVAMLRSEVEADLRPLLWRLARQSAIAALVAGLLAGLVLPVRRMRNVGLVVAGSVGFVALAGAVTVRSFDPDSFDQPKFEGALAAAPDVINTVQRHIVNVNVVEGRLQALSDHVVGLYRSVEGDAPPAAGDTVILHVSDLHSNPVGIQLVEDTAHQFGVDAILDTGDLTSFGASFEELVVDRIAKIVDVPYYVVPGNHDSKAMRAALAGAGIEVLDPGVVEIGGIKILGLGDPTFTADNHVSTPRYERNLAASAERVRRLIRVQHPDVVAVHNPRQLDASLGRFEVGLAGHLHRPSVSYEDGSVVVVAGSAGATGVGALLTDETLPYEMELLRFTAGRLFAVDRIAFDGTDGAFRLERVLIDPDRVAGYPDRDRLPSLFSPLLRRTPPG